jgi:hypothetical protein
LNSPLDLLWLFLALGGVFGLVIFLGLKFRKRGMESDRQLTAREVWDSVPTGPWDFSDLLYGVWQDFSATEIGMIVRNSLDQEIGTVRFRMAARHGWIALQIGESSFEANVLTTPMQSVALCSLAGGETLCTFHRLQGGVYRFELEGTGVLESRPPRGLRFTPQFDYFRDGQPIGISQRIGGWRY